MTCAVLFVVSTVLGTLATALARVLSHRTGILDYPDARKLHNRPIAYLGGLGFCLTMILGVGLFAWLAPLAILEDQSLAVSFLLGLVAIFCVGLWDDVAGMRPYVKLGCQIAVAVFLWWEGVRVERLTVGFGEPLDLLGQSASGLLPFLAASLPSLLLTVAWYAALMNAINLIDGLDGLAGGVCLIASLALGGVGLVVVHDAFTLAAGLPFLAAGACLGFLFHNWHPARIFLGDSGSMSIGYVLATASLVSSTKAPALLTLLIPMVALGLPLFETFFSFARRIVTGKHPFQADRRHLHHRLMDLGLSQRRVVIVFLYATLYLGVNALLLAQGKSALLLVNVAMLGLGLVLLIEFLTFLEKKRASDTDSPDDPPPTGS